MHINLCSRLPTIFHLSSFVAEVAFPENSLVRGRSLNCRPLSCNIQPLPEVMCNMHEQVREAKLRESLVNKMALHSFFLKWETFDFVRGLETVEGVEGREKEKKKGERQNFNFSSFIYLSVDKYHSLLHLVQLFICFICFYSQW